MATEATRQVIPSSADIPGFSVVTASRNQNAARSGVIYNPTSLAAAQPVWFHPMTNGDYMVLFSERLLDATLDTDTTTDGTLLYTNVAPVAPTVSTAPCWTTISPYSGAVKPISLIPSEKEGTRVLTAAASRGEYLFTLNTFQYTEDDPVQALLQHFRVHPWQGVTLMAEEFVPGDLNLGLYADKRYLWVFGNTGDGLGVARKNWGRIGDTIAETAYGNWQFWDRRSWNSDQDKIKPLIDSKNKPIPAHGPCSMARYRDTYYLMPVIKTTHPATDPALPVTPTTPTTLASTLTGAVNQLQALLSGVINGFLKPTAAVVAMISDLLNQAVATITGQNGDVGATITDAVDQFLQGLIGAVAVVTDPAALLEEIIGGLSGLPNLGTAITDAQTFLQGTINTILGLPGAIAAFNPATALEQLIRTITGIASGTGLPVLPGTTTTYTNPSPALTPEPSWTVKVYSSRLVEAAWNEHTFTAPVAATTRLYQHGGAYLQEQIRLTEGFTTTVSSSGVVLLDEFSDHIQVITGTAPHTVVLPDVAKVTGTGISTEGSLLVPDDPAALPTLSIADATVTEGALLPKAVTFRVTLSAATANTVTVKYATGNGTATAGQDYTAATGTLTFAPGILSQQVSVTVQGDLAFEPNETFTVTLSEPTNAAVTDTTAVCTIVNDDRQSVVEALLEQFRNIVNGVISGAINIGSTINQALATVLEQSVRTVTGVVGETGALVVSAVDQFLNSISGGLLDIPGDYGTPADNLANIVALITGGTSAVTETVTGLASTLLNAVVSPTSPVSGLVTGFQNLVGSIFTLFGAANLNVAPMLLAASAATTTTPVTYMPYTIHNQSRADIVVTSSSRDKNVTVAAGSGTTFTPYTAAPTAMSNWSWTYAQYRAPRPRQGYPLLSTRRLLRNTYRLAITGAPASGTFRLIHNGHVTGLITLDADPTVTATNLSVALTKLSSIKNLAIADVSADEFLITIDDDCSALTLYSSTFTGGSSPALAITLTGSATTLLTRWRIFEPNPQQPEKSGLTKAAASSPAATPAPDGLTEILAQFAAVINGISTGLLSVGTGVVTTVTSVLSEAVYLLTGTKLSATDTDATTLITEFLQQLAIAGPGQDAATAFENILRQITGGTGSLDTSAIPSPLDFVTNAVEGTIETLADWLQQIINAILGK